MFKLITFECEIKHEFDTETLEESLSLAVDAFNHGHELHTIEKDGLCLFLYSELYEAIGRGGLLMFNSLEKFVMVLFKTKDLLEPDRWYKVEFWICKKDSKGGYVDTFKMTSGVETHFEEPNSQYIGK